MAITHPTAFIPTSASATSSSSATGFSRAAGVLGHGADVPSVEWRVGESTEVWARDMRMVFELAKERFGDVSWESEDDLMGQSERVWGHKAIIYARAPKAFKDRYFVTRPFARSPASLRSPSPHLLPPLFSSRPSSPPSSYRRPSPIPGRTSSLSVDTFQSEGTVRADRDGILRLTHGDTPELFRAQLEWLYTGEGFGDVVEWISAEDDSGLGGSIRDSLGRRGNLHDRRDKLGQDLTYMWRSKLYADVRIHLDLPFDAPAPVPIADEEDSDDSTDSLSSTAVFTAHKFILASRSPYFASLLINTSSFRPASTSDIHLPTPPFTPAALHFCLGFIYAGHLDFSNRTFDLATAFQIHRAAVYLQLDTLKEEIEARITHDFCHGLEWAKCHCKRCPIRAARVWKFASAPDVGAVVLADKARRYVVKAWAESWGRDIGLMEDKDRAGLVKDVIAAITPGTIVSAYRSVAVLKSRLETAIRNRGREARVWVENVEGMLEQVVSHTNDLLVAQFPVIVESRDFWDLVNGKGFSDDLLDQISSALVDSVGTVKGCVEGPKIYQALVSSILLKVDSNSLQTALPARSRGRQAIEQTKDGILNHIRRRWMQIRAEGGFEGLENWALKEVSDEIEVSIDDILSVAGPSTPRKSARFAPATTPSSKPATKPGIPRTTSSRIVSDTASVRRTASTAPLSSRPSTTRANGSTTPPDPTGLRRLRLSSHASTSSVGSTRSTTARQVSAPVTGPQARSPTAARIGSTVSIGAGAHRRPRTGSPTPSPRTAPRSMSGPPRPLMTKGSSTPRSTPSASARGTPGSVTSRAESPKPTPSVTSTRSLRSTVSTATASRPARPSPGTKATPTQDTASAEPSRLRTASTATTTSVRSKTPTNKTATPVREARPPIPPIPPVPPSGAAIAARAVAKVDSGLRPRTTSRASVASVRSKAPSVVSKAPTIRKQPSAASLAPSMASRVAPSATRSTPATRPIASLTMGTLAKTRPKTPVNPSISLKKPVPARAAGAAIKTALSSPVKSPAPASAIRTRAVSTPHASKPRGHAAFPAALSVKTVRSPSSSTEDPPETRTPRLSSLPPIEPRILRDGSDGSDFGLHAPPSLSSSPTKLPPVSITMPRIPRKISSSSTHSATSSAFKYHPASAFDPPKRIVHVSPPPIEIVDGSKPFDGRGVALHTGIPCIVNLSKKRARFRANIKYIGQMRNSRGPWVGLEVEELDRFEIQTLPAGSKAGTHYFHFSTRQHVPEYDDSRIARQRKIEVIREGLRKNGQKSAMTLGLGLHDALGFFGHGHGSMNGSKRSASPYVDFGSGGLGGPVGFDHPRALFVRPSEIVFVMGAE